MNLFSVGDIAKFFGISKDTVRLYDTMGIIPAKRLENGYRAYSREDLISFAFVIFLKKMNLSLEEIKEIFNNKNIAELHTIITDHVNVLNKELEQIKKNLAMALEYEYVLNNIDQQVNQYRIEMCPPIIYQKIDGDNILSDVQHFNESYDHDLAMFTFIIPKEFFLTCNSQMFRKEKNHLNYAMTLVNYKGKFIDEKHYKVIQPRLCLISVIETMVNKDYDSIVSVREYLAKTPYSIHGDIFLRHLFARGYPDQMKDYYEIIIPLK